MTLTEINAELNFRLAHFMENKKTGKVSLEVNLSQGGIGQVFLETKEAISMKR